MVSIKKYWPDHCFVNNLPKTDKREGKIKANALELNLNPEEWLDKEINLLCFIAPRNFFVEDSTTTE